MSDGEKAALERVEVACGGGWMGELGGGGRSERGGKTPCLAHFPQLPAPGFTSSSKPVRLHGVSIHLRVNVLLVTSRSVHDGGGYI